MKNLLLLFLMIGFGFFANAQLEAQNNPKPKVSAKLNKMEINFKDFADAKRFQNSLNKGLSGLDQIDINEGFEFTFTIGEVQQIEGLSTELSAIKIVITDQKNKEALIKEINDAIDGLELLINDDF